MSLSVIFRTFCFTPAAAEKSFSAEAGRGSATSRKSPAGQIAS